MRHQVCVRHPNRAIRGAPLLFRSRLSRRASALPKPVEPGREERATRVETPGSQRANPTPALRPPHHGFDTPHSLTLAGRLNQLREEQSRLSRGARTLSKPVEPGREERATRVETTNSQRANPTPALRPPHHGFDTPHSLTLAGRLNQLREEQSRLSRRARNERPESKPPTAKEQSRPQLSGHPHHGFDTTHSLTLAGRLNQLQEQQSRLSQHVSEANG